MREERRPRYRDPQDRRKQDGNFFKEIKCLSGEDYIQQADCLNEDFSGLKANRFGYLLLWLQAVFTFIFGTPYYYNQP